MPVTPKYTPYALSPGIQESISALSETLVKTVELPDFTAWAKSIPLMDTDWIKNLKLPGVSYSAPPPRPAYFNWTWDEVPEIQADQACFDDL